jgi:hypothetical protein
MVDSRIMIEIENEQKRKLLFKTQLITLLTAVKENPDILDEISLMKISKMKTFKEGFCRKMEKNNFPKSLKTLVKQKISKYDEIFFGYLKKASINFKDDFNKFINLQKRFLGFMEYDIYKNIPNSPLDDFGGYEEFYKLNVLLTLYEPIYFCILISETYYNESLFILNSKFSDSPKNYFNDSEKNHFDRLLETLIFYDTLIAICQVKLQYIWKKIQIVFEKNYSQITNLLKFKVENIIRNFKYKLNPLDKMTLIDSRTIEKCADFEISGDFSEMYDVISTLINNALIAVREYAIFETYFYSLIYIDDKTISPFMNKKENDYNYAIIESFTLLRKFPIKKLTKYIFSIIFDDKSESISDFEPIKEKTLEEAIRISRVIHNKQSLVNAYDLEIKRLMRLIIDPKNPLPRALELEYLDIIDSNSLKIEEIGEFKELPEFTLEILETCELISFI